MGEAAENLLKQALSLSQEDRASWKHTLSRPFPGLP
jgi:hypothetical protein